MGLALAGLSLSAAFAVLLVLMRAPGLAVLPVALFPATLALHVDLAVIVWFLSVASSLFAAHQRRSAPWIDRGSWLLGALGAATLVVSAFVGGGAAYMNNYVPVLADPLFGLGLGAFLAGVGVTAARTVLEGPSTEPARLGAWCGAATVLVALAAIGASAWGLPSGLSGAPRYEALFWAGGHLLQFTHSTLVLLVWAMLARAGGLGPPMPAGTFVLATLPLLAAPFGYLDGVGGPEHRLHFTSMMRWGTWLALPLALAGIARAWRRAPPINEETRPLRTLFLLSVALFLCGLTVGAFIRYDGLLVTAHYHATVGAVTLAYFGWARLLAARAGLAVAGARVANLQALLYGGGLFVLVAGLAVSGHFGLPRKTPDAQHPAAEGAQTVGMLLVSSGGAIALGAVFLFLATALVALLRGRRAGLAWPARS